MNHLTALMLLCLPLCFYCPKKYLLKNLVSWGDVSRENVSVSHEGISQRSTPCRGFERKHDFSRHKVSVAVFGLGQLREWRRHRRGRSGRQRSWRCRRRWRALLSPLLLLAVHLRSSGAPFQCLDASRAVVFDGVGVSSTPPAQGRSLR